MGQRAAHRAQAENGDGGQVRGHGHASTPVQGRGIGRQSKPVYALSTVLGFCLSVFSFCRAPGAAKYLQKSTYYAEDAARRDLASGPPEKAFEDQAQGGE